MTTENENPADDQNNVVAKLTKDLSDMAERIEAMDRKNQELLEEKRKKSEAAKAAEEELEKEKLKKSGDVDKLLEIEKRKTEAAEKATLDLLNEIKQEKIKSLAASLANEMGGRPESIKILTKCVVEEISNLVDAKGNLSDVKQKLVIQNFKDSTEYKPLLIGNRSSGGGAEGSSGETTQAFSDLTPKESKALFQKDPKRWEQMKSASK